MYSALDISRYVIESINNISTMSLQKIMYYLQGYHLALTGQKLFNADFEAWVYGPVIPDIYRVYKGHAFIPPDKKVGSILDFNQNEEDRCFIDLVIEEYSRYSEYELAEMSMSEKPWRETRKGLRDDETAYRVISPSIMEEHFKGRLDMVS